LAARSGEINPGSVWKAEMTQSQSHSSEQSVNASRYSWVDCAKGICIVSVVALWVDRILELDQGWLHTYVLFAKPFRMPDFFLLSGLFLHRVISKPWRHYLDTKVVHYLYFLILWTLLILIVATWILHPPSGVADVLQQILAALYHPIGMLWFILILPIYFIVTRLTQRVPWPVMLGCAAIFMVFPLNTKIPVVDWFGEYYVYFYAGYLFSAKIFDFADQVGNRYYLAWLAIFAWVLINGYVTLALRLGWSDFLALSLVLGFVGIGAIIAISKLISNHPMFGWLAYLGKNSIVVYLGFYIPLNLVNFAARRIPLDIKSNFSSTLVWISCIAVSVLAYWAIKDTRLSLLYKRPNWAKIA
jgi:uncharacterized membrane protein YcfT